MSKPLKPSEDYIIVKVEKLAKTKSGVNLTRENQDQEFGTVVNPGIYPYKKGQRVFFKSFSAITVKIDKENITFVKAEDVLGYE